MRLSMLSARLLALVLVGGVFAGGSPVNAQSLGRLAVEEAARRKAIPSPARVVTEDDLGPAASPPSGEVSSPAPELPHADAPPVKRLAVAAAQLKGGALPQVPFQAVSGGEVVLEVSVSKAGRVTAVKPLRHTAPFTDAVVAAVRTWTFAPAEDAPVPSPGVPADSSARAPMNSSVLVVAVFTHPRSSMARLASLQRTWPRRRAPRRSPRGRS